MQRLGSEREAAEDPACICAAPPLPIRSLRIHATAGLTLDLDLDLLLP